MAIACIKANTQNSFVDGPFGSNLKTEHFIDGGDVYVIDSGYITSGRFDIKREFKTISMEHFLTVNRSQCFEDDIIISKIGANFGMSGILPYLDKPSLVSGNTLKLTINRKTYDLAFIHYQFLNLKMNGSFDALVKGSAQPALSMGLLNLLKFAIPPLAEQKAIADYLDTKTAQIDQIIQTINTQIEKLKELRKTLINDVVTGKIKVMDN
ncbi:MAG: restriction endonuclease subunit S [Crocosphaera sp.]